MFFMMTPTSHIFCVAYNALVLPAKQWRQKLLKTHPQDGQLALCIVERQHRDPCDICFLMGPDAFLVFPSHIRSVRTCVLCHETWHSLHHRRNSNRVRAKKV